MNQALELLHSQVKVECDAMGPVAQELAQGGAFRDLDGQGGHLVVRQQLLVTVRGHGSQLGYHLS